MKRLFIGLSPSDEEKQQIALWRHHHLSSNFGEKFRSVDKGNFHITLSFIGAIESEQLVNLIDTIERIEKPKCSISLNQLDCWAKPKVLFLTSISTVESIQKLAANVIAAVRSNDIFQEERPYIPHLTLCRKAKTAPIVTEAFKFKLDFQQCHLFESVPTDTGVQYNIIYTWPLS
ncbi:MAG: RNA 2',3'-cyclic phosphodiesterase [Thalassotalea sp.]|nr:RNA 2',3'-cyclic phosphodiesterase [Thalassotalea sp.]